MAQGATTFATLAADAPGSARPKRKKRSQKNRRFKTKDLTAAQKARVSAAFSEVKRDEPAIVSKTRKKSGKAAAARQKVAIALSKADLPVLRQRTKF